MGYICYQQEKQKEEPTGKTTIYKKNSNRNDEIEIESHDTKEEINANNNKNNNGNNDIKNINSNNQDKNTKKHISKSVIIHKSGEFDKLEKETFIKKEEDKNDKKANNNIEPIPKDQAEIKPNNAEEKEKEKNEIKEEKSEPNIIKQMIVDEAKIRTHVDLETANKISKAVCKILIKINERTQAGTGFFLTYKNINYLITCYHVVNSKIKKFDIEIWDKKIFSLELSNRYIEYFDGIFDITAIELKRSDEFVNYIDYLDYDLNYIKGYTQYKNINIFNLGYPKGLNSVAESGKIEKIIENEFYHDINTEKGSSGSPIILFNTLKVIGIHKQADIEKKLNVGTFIDVIFKKIDENMRDKKENLNEINEEENAANIIEIELLDQYKCKITYKLSEKNYTDLGFLIRIPIFNKTSYINGILTKYYINEYTIFNTKGINIYDNNILLDNFTSDDRFIFSDEFLNITFIEIKNLNLNFIDIYDNNNIYGEITLINYSQETNTVTTTYGKFIEKWGVYLKYEEFDDLLYYNYQSSHVNSGLLINNKLIGIYKQDSFKHGIATNIDIISKVIEFNYSSYKNDILKYIEQKGKQNLLNENQINELKSKGMELTNISNVLISPPAFYITPIWFLRTKHAWYWTPLKPGKNDINKSNWMLIYPNNSLKSVGSIYDGQEPAPKNIEIIQWLENTKFNYL